jgi:phage recombination protein Bet
MTALTKVEKFDHTVSTTSFSGSEIELIRDTICKGGTPEEFNLFLNVCKMTGLNPFVKQIYAIKRWDNNLKREAMTPQTSIDGFRLIADRTGRYCPGREPTYEYNTDGSLKKATAYLKKQTMDGTWQEVSAHAFYDEFCQKYKDKQTQQMKPTAFWQNMGHNQLAKCAETLAIKKAFPAETAGLQGQETMEQAYIESDPEENINTRKLNVKQIYTKKINTNQALELAHTLAHCSEIVQKNFMEYIKTKFKIQLLDDLPESEYEKTKNMLSMRRDEYQTEKAKNDDKVDEDTGEVVDE